MILALLALPKAQARKGILVEAVLAKVGITAVHYSDVLRFLAIESAMLCSGIRKRTGARFEPLINSLNRYVDEELIYLEARLRITEVSGIFADAIKQMKAKPSCWSKWQRLGKKYSQLWSTRADPKAGERALHRELEKQLLVGRYQKQRLGSDRDSWLRGAKLKTPVKIYVDLRQ